ncbi:acidic mammalian chitinase-like [Harmonia axyridis]|uniref:acidic mammalian chitinase-like n=1 Tax=Harmonia axyridis TaxID=115357 RepID=UPI001E276D87|nr:acidic mammalian chitinase-like [Harmonia axyridis]
MKSSSIIFLFVVIFSCGFLLRQSEAVNVYCYYASWAAERPDHAKVSGDDLDPNLCTHIFYAFLSLNPEDDGKLSYLDEELDVKLGNIQKVSDLKKINPNLKLLFSVGGASAAPYVFAAIAADETKLANFVKSSEEFLDKYNFDGIDIDWEYPYDKPLLLKMAQALKDRFQPKGRLVTTAVAYNPEDAGYDVKGMNEVFDLINVMSYDFHGAYAGKLGQNAPLYGSSSESSWQQTVLNCNASLWNWRNKGAVPEKLSLGAGFYGHTFKMVDVSQNSPGDAASGPWDKGPYTDNMGTLGYLELCELHKSGTTRWDDEQKVPYMTDGNMWAGFDNEKSLREKIKYIKQEGISGIMIWSIETDDVKGICGGRKWPLLNAINDEIKNKNI